jgi:hypothetical protein
MSYLGTPTSSNWLSSGVKWFGTNLLFYVGGAVLFGIGFLVFATVYAYLFPKPVGPSFVPPAQNAPVIVAPTEPLPIAPPLRLEPSDKVGPVAGPSGVATPISKLTDKDLIGKKFVTQQRGFLGYIMVVNRDEHGNIVSLGVSSSPDPGVSPIITEVKITPSFR